MVEFLLIIVIFCLISAVLAIQTQESLLSLKVKKWLLLSQPYSKPLLALSKFKAWRKLLGTASFVLLPLIVSVIVLIRLHAFLSELLDCVYCSSFHYTWLLLYFAAGFPLIASVILAPLGILAVYFIERLRV